MNLGLNITYPPGERFVPVVQTIAAACAAFVRELDALGVEASVAITLALEIGVQPGDEGHALGDDETGRPASVVPFPSPLVPGNRRGR